MSDDLRNPIGMPPEDDGADEGEVVEEDYEELEEMPVEIDDEAEDQT